MINFIYTAFERLIDVIAIVLLATGIVPIDDVEIFSPVAVKEKYVEKQETTLLSIEDIEVLEIVIEPEEEPEDLIEVGIRDLEQMLKDAKLLLQEKAAELALVDFVDFAPKPLLEVDKIARPALVNILCTNTGGGLLRTITGSGVVIDPRGVILTNAHVAQYFLLKDYRVENFLSCAIRTGNPAKSKYTADVLYISPFWIKENVSTIKDQTPKGTGESDFALLRIVGTVNPKDEIPETFPFLKIDPDFSTVFSDHPVLILGYPAGFLGGGVIQKNLGLVSSPATIKELFTFYEETPDYLDFVSLGGSAVAQQGTSGGAVVDQIDSDLIGIVVTTTSEDSTGDRDLGAITISHIDRSLKEQRGETLRQFLSYDLADLAQQFLENQFNPLSKLLIEELDK